MHRPLAAAIIAALASCAAGAAEGPDYSLTVYSAAQPGQLSTSNLAGYGANLPGYALVRDARRMTLPHGVGELRFTDVVGLMGAVREGKRSGSRRAISNASRTLAGTTL